MDPKEFARRVLQQPKGQLAASLPRSVRRQLEAKARKLWSELGVKPKFDRSTGAQVYEAADIARALGMSEEGVMISLAEAGMEPRMTDAADVEPLQ